MSAVKTAVNASGLRASNPAAVIASSRVVRVTVSAWWRAPAPRGLEAAATALPHVASIATPIVVTRSLRFISMRVPFHP
jgi:hypothetical protein